MGVERRRSRRRAAAFGAALVLVAPACLRPQPSREGAPGSAPAAGPAPAPERPAESSAPPSPAKADARASGAADTVGGGERPEPPESKPKGRPAAARKSSSGGLSALRAEAAASVGDLRRRLDRVYGASTPDCPSARERKKAVCDLATQICSLTERDPNVASVAEYCEDARRRCLDARQRTSRRCPDNE